MGDFPIMTETGTFIINGAGACLFVHLVYIMLQIMTKLVKDSSSTVIPNRGACGFDETDSNDVFSAC